jgi:uncharacterized protein (TIGR02145 family)
MKQILWILPLGLATSFWACSESTSSVDDNNIYESLESFTDSRNNREYKKVTIGEQTWMAENLYYEKYFYTWEEAQKACPEGWHLPNDNEWKTLFNEVGGVDQAGLQLKTTSGWETGENGMDFYGFAASPTGYRDTLDEHQKKGYRALFWSATELDSQNAYNWRFDGVSDYVFHEDYSKKFKLSVRCIENNISEESSSSSEEKSSSSSIIQSSSSEIKSSSSKATQTSSSSSSIVSSSSQIQSSSSEEISSSSKPAILNGYDPINQTLTDDRDGHVYKTTTIDNRVWMAENLNFAYNFKSARSLCYQNDTAFCTKYGRLYSWAAAIDSAGSFSKDSIECTLPNSECNLSKVTRGMCPEGWHIPSIIEWNDLLYFIGGYQTQKLKTKQGWNKGEGTDEFGFSLLPAGESYSSKFEGEGEYLRLWTIYKKYGSSINIYTSEGFSYSTSGSTNFLSIRCIMNYDDKKEISKPDNVYGTIEDSRDNNIYKTVQIGDQTWMAENLRLDNNDESFKSKCPIDTTEKDSTKYCNSFGRLYTWLTAIDTAAIYSDDAKECKDDYNCNALKIIRGICPEGWRIPNEDDIENLGKNAGGIGIAGRNLKSQDGWSNGDTGYDLYGFNATPAIGKDLAGYWTTTSFKEIYPRYFYFWNFSIDFSTSSSSRETYYPIRCIKMTQEEIDSKKTDITD